MFRTISIIDLLSFEESKKIIEAGDEAAFYELLDDIGFDINKPIEWEVCYHRPMVLVGVDNSPKYTARIVGEEKDTWEWIRSPYCSFELKMEIYYRHDREMYEDLKAMSDVPNFTQMAMDKALEESTRYNEDGNVVLPEKYHMERM